MRKFPLCLIFVLLFGLCACAETHSPDFVPLQESAPPLTFREGLYPKKDLTPDIIPAVGNLLLENELCRITVLQTEEETGIMTLEIENKSDTTCAYRTSDSYVANHLCLPEMIAFLAPAEIQTVEMSLPKSCRQAGLHDFSNMQLHLIIWNPDAEPSASSLFDGWIQYGQDEENGDAVFHFEPQDSALILVDDETMFASLLSLDYTEKEEYALSVYVENRSLKPVTYFISDITVNDGNHIPFIALKELQPQYSCCLRDVISPISLAELEDPTIRQMSFILKTESQNHKNLSTFSCTFQVSDILPGQNCAISNLSVVPQ